MRYLLMVLVLIILGSIYLAPHELYRLKDFFFPNQEVFEASVIGNTSYGDDEIIIIPFEVTRSGYYEIGLLFNEGVNKKEIDNQFDKALEIIVKAKSGTVVFSESIAGFSYYKPVSRTQNNTIKEAIFVKVPINTVINGAEYNLMISGKNKVLDNKSQVLYIAISDYY